MRKKTFILNFYYSFPVQLFLLHFKKYQVLLLIWYLLFSTISGGFMKNFGAASLFFAPEYIGKTNFFSYTLIGIAWGMFIMSWNITTFILHSKRFKFLAATSHPFLKYCINNAVLPLAFLVYYFIVFSRYISSEELLSGGEVTINILGVLLGITILFLISFAYFFGASRTIDRSMASIISDPVLFKKTFGSRSMRIDEYGMKVRYYLNEFLKLRKVRTVGHYRQDFIDSMFKRHHLSAIALILLAFIFLASIGFFLDNPIFELPAGACALVFFSLLIAVMGALGYFMDSWSLPFVIVGILLVNFLFKHEIIDPRNKAYGLNYTNKKERPVYDNVSLLSYCTPEKVQADKNNMITILERWKQKQKDEKPLMVFINVSGGGLRSAAFTMNSLQQLDSLSGNRLMHSSFMISGASGGMLASTYYRELYRLKQDGQAINLTSEAYNKNITRDLLNPVFTSLMARDLLAPAQKFKVGGYSYVKDRGYAFEKKLGDNTDGLLNVALEDIAKDEYEAKVPLLFFNTVINSDGRKLIIGTQPMSFMMKAAGNEYDKTISPDVIDYGAFFHKQNPMNLRLVTALRMNATFPYVLPNVWLPSEPVVDVMDAGIRDNFGPETTFRFIDQFKEWISENTSGVLILQIRDRNLDNWAEPVETKTIGDMVVTPATVLTQNWYKLQGYAQQDQFNFFKKAMTFPIYREILAYEPKEKGKTAALSFHLTADEKQDVIRSFFNTHNTAVRKKVIRLLSGSATAEAN